MTAAVPESMEWPTGVGGVQCDHCGRFTICRGFDVDTSLDDEQWLCRPCAEGWSDDEGAVMEDE